MTVTSTTAISGPYDGDGGTVTFDYTFYIASASELKVTLADSDGVETVQTLTTHYSVTIGDDGTGTFTMVTAPATGESVVATLNVELKQETDLLNLGTFSAEIHETAWDKLTRICQQINEAVGRCIKVGPTSDSDPDDVTLETWTASAPVSTTNFSRILSTEATVQDALDELDAGAGKLEESRVLLDEATASASATVEVAAAAASNYDVLEVELVSIRPATDSVQITLVMSEDTGLTWETGATRYNWKTLARSTAYADVAVSDTSDSSIEIVPTGYEMGNTASEALSGSLRVYHASTSALPHVDGRLVYRDYTSLPYTALVLGGYNAVAGTGSVDGFQIAASSGNITSGTLRLWGLPTGS